MIPYSGNLGLNSGVAQSVYQLNTSGMHRIATPVQVLTPGQSMKLPGGAGTLTFTGYKQWISLQVTYDPGQVTGPDLRGRRPRRPGAVLPHPAAADLRPRPRRRYRAAPSSRWPAWPAPTWGAGRRGVRGAGGRAPGGPWRGGRWPGRRRGARSRGRRCRHAVEGPARPCGPGGASAGTRSRGYRRGPRGPGRTRGADQARGRWCGPGGPGRRGRTQQRQ